MMNRSLLIPGLLAGALMLPLAANAQQPACHWGPKGDCAQVISDTLDKVSVDLNKAVDAAKKEAKGAVQGARLSAFGFPGEEPMPPRDEARKLSPTWMIMMGDADERTLVAVDAESGNAEVVGNATGMFAKAPFHHMGGWRYRGEHKGWGGKGFGPAADMSEAKTDASKAIAVASDAVKDAKPVMVRGVKSDEGTEGTAWMVTMKGSGDAPERSMTMVFVDGATGKVLKSERFEPGKFGPRGEGMRGEGPRGDGPRGDGPRGDGPRGEGPRGPAPRQAE